MEVCIYGGMGKRRVARIGRIQLQKRSTAISVNCFKVGVLLRISTRKAKVLDVKFISKKTWVKY